LLVLIHLPVASVQKEKKKRKESISSTHFVGKYKQSQKKKKKHDWITANTKDKVSEMMNKLYSTEIPMICKRRNRSYVIRN
jgi:hypothetical protein